MKFLVTFIPRRQQLPPLGMVDMVKTWINTHLASKKLDCAHALVTGGGVCIVNAASGEDLTRFLIEYPGAMFVDTTVQALAEVNSTLDQLKVVLTNAHSAMAAART